MRLILLIFTAMMISFPSAHAAKRSSKRQVGPQSEGKRIQSSKSVGKKKKSTPSRAGRRSVFDPDKPCKDLLLPIADYVNVQIDFRDQQKFFSRISRLLIGSASALDKTVGDINTGALLPMGLNLSLTEDRLGLKNGETLINTIDFTEPIVDVRYRKVSRDEGYLSVFRWTRAEHFHLKKGSLTRVSARRLLNERISELLPPVFRPRFEVENGKVFYNLNLENLWLWNRYEVEIPDETIDILEAAEIEVDPSRTRGQGGNVYLRDKLIEFNRAIGKDTLRLVGPLPLHHQEEALIDLLLLAKWQTRSPARPIFPEAFGKLAQLILVSSGEFVTNGNQELKNPKIAGYPTLFLRTAVMALREFPALREIFADIVNEHDVGIRLDPPRGRFHSSEQDIGFIVRGSSLRQNSVYIRFANDAFRDQDYITVSSRSFVNP